MNKLDKKFIEKIYYILGLSLLFLAFRLQGVKDLEKGFNELCILSVITIICGYLIHRNLKYISSIIVMIMFLKFMNHAYWDVGYLAHTTKLEIYRLLQTFLSFYPPILAIITLFTNQKTKE